MISSSSTVLLDVEKSGNFKTSKFRIAANAKMFKILSSGLYKNKIRAIVREYSTNAIDGHIVNGNPTEPFLVKLPNHLDPNFVIRDYGIGLTEKEIREIYTTYGESTKDALNSLNGTFGLGSKSAFSYTDSFTVNSYKDGIKTTYSMYIDERGEPECARLTAIKTTEKNGVEIIIPVRREDYDNFRKEAQLVYTFFKVKPTVTGNSIYKNQITSEPVMQEKGSWEVYNNANGLNIFNESKAILVMADCCYPIDLGAVGIGYGHWLFNNNYVVIYVDTGDVDITVSRESLEYIPHTINSIQKKLDEIEVSYKVKLEKELDNCPCYYDACLKYWQQPLRVNGITYKGTLIKTSVDNPLYKIGDPNQESLYFDCYYSNPKPTHASSICLSRKIHFYIDDLDKGSHSRFQKYCNNTGIDGILIKTQDKKRIKAFKDEVGLTDDYIKKVSDLPALPKTTRTTQKVGGYRLIDARSNSWHYRDNITNCWERLEDLPAKSIVVGFDQYYALDGNNKKIRPQDLRNQIANLPASFHIDVKDIYGLSKEKFKKATSKGFINLWDHLKSLLKKELVSNKANYETLLEYNQLFSLSNFIDISLFIDNITSLAGVGCPPILDKINKLVDIAKKIAARDQTTQTITLIQNYFPNELKPSTELTKLIIEVYQKAPLLNYIEWHEYNTPVKRQVVTQVAKYLKLVL